MFTSTQVQMLQREAERNLLSFNNIEGVNDESIGLNCLVDNVRLIIAREGFWMGSKGIIFLPNLPVIDDDVNREKIGDNALTHLYGIACVYHDAVRVPFLATSRMIEMAKYHG